MKVSTKLWAIHYRNRSSHNQSLRLPRKKKNTPLWLLILVCPILLSVSTANGILRFKNDSVAMDHYACHISDSDTNYSLTFQSNHFVYFFPHPKSKPLQEAVEILVDVMTFLFVWFVIVSLAASYIKGYKLFIYASHSPTDTVAARLTKPIDFCPLIYGGEGKLYC